MKRIENWQKYLPETITRMNIHSANYNAAVKKDARNASFWLMTVSGDDCTSVM